jgi:hypothetical protein
MQVAVERYAAGQELDFELLCGSWRLCYTTARDVLPLVAPQRPPALVQVRSRGCRAAVAEGLQLELHGGRCQPGALPLPCMRTPPFPIPQPLDPKQWTNSDVLPALLSPPSPTQPLGRWAPFTSASAHSPRAACKM